MDTMDSIIDTVCAPHPILPLIGLLKTNGKLIVVGPQILKPPELPYAPLIMGMFIINSLVFLFCFCYYSIYIYVLYLSYMF